MKKYYLNIKLLKKIGKLEAMLSAAQDEIE